MSGLKIPASAIDLRTSGATISSAELISASAPDNINGEFCKVIGNIHPVTYSAPDIEFEVNLPPIGTANHCSSVAEDSMGGLSPD